jgi:hypothetical protein
VLDPLLIAKPELSAKGLNSLLSVFAIGLDDQPLKNPQKFLEEDDINHSIGWASAFPQDPTNAFKIV